MLVGVGSARALEPSSRWGQDIAPPKACGEIGVDAQIAIRPDGFDADRRHRRVNAEISIFVENRCDTPLEVGYGSSIDYRTSFPDELERAGQPAPCRDGRWSFSGTVPPRQRRPFTHRLESCLHPVDHSEPPRVRVEGGRLVTKETSRPIPAVERVLP